MGDSKNKGNRKNSGANVRFTEIEDGGPRNSAISTDRADVGSEENGVNLCRAVSFNIENNLRPIGTRGGPWGEKPNNGRSCVIDTCFIFGAMCSFNSTRRYKGYLEVTSPQIPNIHRARGAIKIWFRNSRFGRF